MKVTTIALPETLHERLSSAASQRGTVMTELVRQAVAEWLKRNPAPRRGGK
jgi:predicted transcriptional regulator